jgi:hypothetical protein
MLYHLWQYVFLSEGHRLTVVTPKKLEFVSDFECLKDRSLVEDHKRMSKAGHSERLNGLHFTNRNERKHRRV